MILNQLEAIVQRNDYNDDKDSDIDDYDASNNQEKKQKIIFGGVGAVKKTNIWTRTRTKHYLR